MKFIVTVTETENRPLTGPNNPDEKALFSEHQREIYRQAFDALDLPRFIQALNKPAPKPRKKRSDIGAKRGDAKEQ